MSVLLIAEHNNKEVKPFTYNAVTAASEINDNLDVLVINALRIEAHYSHLSLSDALKIIIKVKPKKAYITHISHKLGFHQDVQKKLPKNVYLAYDGLVVNSN